MSREAFEMVTGERDRLRDQVDGLLDHVKRIDRIEHGASELPRQPRPVMQPMPEGLKTYIEGFANPSLRKSMRDQGYRQHAAGVPWPTIEAAVKAAEKEAEDE